MALFPCDLGNHRYRGAQQTIYPALVNGSEAYRRKMRLCPAHFEIRVDALSSRAAFAQIDFYEANEAKCLVCQETVSDSAWQFFATVYAARSERLDYWALVHDHCAPTVRAEWHLEPEVP